MINQTALDDANIFMVQQLIQKYLSSQTVVVSTIWDACVTTYRMANRHGVPADARTYRYEFTHPELGFAFTARAVWRSSHLMQPKGIHTVIVDYEDCGSHGSDEAVALVVNDWLQSVPL